MIELWAIVIQFLLAALIIKDKDVILYCIGVALTFCLSNLLIGVGDYYIRHLLFDVLFISIIPLLKDRVKQTLLFTVCFCSLLMNYYEWQSVYQTPLYPYRDTLQWWMVELMFIITCWKCTWREHIEICRNYYNSRGRF